MSALGLEVVVELRLEVAAGVREAARKLMVKESEAQTMAVTELGRQGEGGQMKMASSTREVAAVASCRSEEADPFSASLVRYLCLEGMVYREWGERLRRAASERIAAMLPSLRGTKSPGLL